MDTKNMKTVYTVVDRAHGKSAWVRIGIGFVNKDGSINLKLDASPTNGTLQIRDWEARDSTSDIPDRRTEGGPNGNPRAQELLG